VRGSGGVFGLLLLRRCVSAFLSRAEENSMDDWGGGGGVSMKTWDGKPTK